MATITQTLTFTRTINAPVSQVYRAFTNATAVRQWLCDMAHVDARKGGPVFFVWRSTYYASGSYSVLDENKRVMLSWHGKGEPAPTEIEVLLEPRGKSTQVRLKHSGIGDDQTWGATIKQFNKGWEIGLDNLQSILETGIDQRQAQRPILGISGIDDLDERRAANLGVPVKKGIVIGSPLEGVGVAAAGLIDNDVIVSIGGKPVPDIAAFARIMTAHKVGDVVKVEYYHGAEKHVADVTLPAHPQPEVPSTLDGLVKALTAAHKELDAELDAIFDGVSEAEASHRPAPGEWNAKEALAHLIWTERFMHFWMWGLIGGDDSIPWPDNNPGHIDGLIAAYPTAAELLAEMKRTEAGTRGIVAGLSPEFVANPANYRRVGINVLGLPLHSQDHFSQMRAAIASARKK